MVKARKRRPQKIRDRPGDICSVSGEVDERLSVFQALWNLPWREGVLVDVDGLERRKAGEEVGWDGGEAVVVEEEDFKLGEAAEGGERAGEAVVLELKAAEGGEVAEFGRQSTGEAAVSDLYAGDAAGRLTGDLGPVAGIWVSPFEGCGAIDVLGESLHCLYICSVGLGLCNWDERDEKPHCNEKECNFHLDHGRRRDFRDGSFFFSSKDCNFHLENGRRRDFRDGFLFFSSKDSNFHLDNGRRRDLRAGFFKRKEREIGKFQFLSKRTK